jgi:hypothetical protein
MFYRVVVNVINVITQIELIADGVLDEPWLPSKMDVAHARHASLGRAIPWHERHQIGRLAVL